MKERSQRRDRVLAVLATRRADWVRCVYARRLGPVLALARAQVIVVSSISRALLRRWRPQIAETIFVTRLGTFIGCSAIDQVAKFPRMILACLFAWVVLVYSMTKVTVHEFDLSYGGLEAGMVDSLVGVVWVVLLAAGLLGLCVALAMLYFTSGSHAGQWADPD